MTQKQPKYNRDGKFRNRQLIDVNEENRRARRPVIFSSDDSDRMAVESNRAKIMRQLITDPDSERSRGEFGSYFLGPKKEADPVSSVTSHMTKERDQPLRSVISTYPTLVQNIQWDPDGDISSVYNLQTNVRDVEEGSAFICKCQKCGTKHCRGQARGTRIFKDNITRFCDNSTMTLKLNNASCGSCTAVPMSNASTSGSDIAVRDNQCTMAVPQIYTDLDPISILKKSSRYEPVQGQEQIEYDNFCTQTEKKCRIEDNYFAEAVRDTEVDDYYEYTESKPIRPFPKIVRNRYQNCDRNEGEHRKNIYNEGISTLSANYVPTTYEHVPKRIKSPTNLKAGYTRSKTSFVKKTQKTDNMLFAHNTDSKYHYDCKQAQTKGYNTSNNITEGVEIGKRFRKTCPSGVFVSNTPSIKLPRRVLTSERDIESYIGNRPIKIRNR